MKNKLIRKMLKDCIDPVIADLVLTDEQLETLCAIMTDISLAGLVEFKPELVSHQAAKDQNRLPVTLKWLHEHPDILGHLFYCDHNEEDLWFAITRVQLTDDEYVASYFNARDERRALPFGADYEAFVSIEQLNELYGVTL